MPGYDWMDPDPERTARERKRRNVAIAAVLAGLVVLFYVMTMIRVHP
jgi:hypothetical protein